MDNTVVACTSGVVDCSFDVNGQCAPFDGEFTNIMGEEWTLIVGFIFMAIMAFGIGANDLANSWATSVGSGAVSLRRAALVSGVANWLGAVTLGYGVSNTIQTGVAKINDPDCWACGFCDSQISLYAIGMLSALIGSTIFTLLATWTEMPISTTHTIVGGVTGMTIFAVGGECLNWKFSGGLAGIVASWIISPILSGVIAIVLYEITNRLVFTSKHPSRNAIRSLPLLYAGSTFTMVFLILLKSKPTKKMDKWYMVLIAAGATIVVATIVRYVLVPYVKRSILSPSPDMDISIHLDADRATDMSDGARVLVHSPAFTKGNVEEPMHLDIDHTQSADHQAAMKVFKYALLLVATLESYAQGANDIANSTAPLSAVYTIYQDGLQSCKNFDTPVWMMAIAGGFVFIGINTLGYKVMLTVGSKISSINIHRGFCMELASTITVVVATLLKLPVSSTHCEVGAVVLLSVYTVGKSKVSLRTVGMIVSSWFITLPFAGLLATLFTALLRPAVE